ncbi:MAG: twin-arginine translocase subunit TatB [Proteobacteria bacterium]|nr:MAG: twin-arginine translocase subunit TatB [Pseudomonadota bacterium]
MLDIGFAELLVVSAVALFVVGPERLPSAIRAISLWLGRVRRGFEEIKADVSRELHNEEVMRALRESRDEVQDLTDVSSALSLDPVALNPVDHEKSGAHEANAHGNDTPALDTSAEGTVPSPSDSSVGSEKPTQ